MKDFPSCFGESGVQVVDSSSSKAAAKSAQNLVMLLYQARLGRGSCLISVTWSRQLVGHALAVGIDDSAGRCVCKVDVKPWLFSRWRGSKGMEADGTRIEILWDLSGAKYGTGPEPLEGFYVAVLFDREAVLTLGDLKEEAQRKTSARSPSSTAVLVAKKEHVVGRGVYSTKARFCGDGEVHDVAVECETAGVRDPALVIRIDKKRVMQVKRLSWKFRGNQTISVDGAPVEVFWDVHSWLFGGQDRSAVFMFQSCSAAEEKLVALSPSASKETRLRGGLGFSLVLYAWKNE